mmetsp:Transcript_18044/g.37170  ORF Transcript_18044/g.37170 Transcript_18044/m.37170 type:complete len:407 (+) Transcript_18044:185-1405(+)
MGPPGTTPGTTGTTIGVAKAVGIMVGLCAAAICVAWRVCRVLRAAEVGVLKPAAVGEASVPKGFWMALVIEARTVSMEAAEVGEGVWGPSRLSATELCWCCSCWRPPARSCGLSAACMLSAAVVFRGDSRGDSLAFLAKESTVCALFWEEDLKKAPPAPPPQVPLLPFLLNPLGKTLLLRSLNTVVSTLFLRAAALLPSRPAPRLLLKPSGVVGSRSSDSTLRGRGLTSVGMDFQPSHCSLMGMGMSMKAAPLGASLLARTRMGAETAEPMVSPVSASSTLKRRRNRVFLSPMDTWVHASSMEMNRKRWSFEGSFDESFFWCWKISPQRFPSLPNRWIALRMGPLQPRLQNFLDTSLQAYSVVVAVSPPSAPFFPSASFWTWTGSGTEYTTNTLSRSAGLLWSFSS